MTAEQNSNVLEDVSEDVLLPGTPKKEEEQQQQPEPSRKKGRQRKSALYASILKQLEFYFSDSNLSKDRFLAELVKTDPYVDLNVFLKFNRIRTLTTEVKHIAKAIKHSEILEISEDGTKVKRTTPVTFKEDVDDCTVYVQRIPPDADHDWLTTQFSKYGKVTYVSIPKFTRNNKIKGFAFIEFDTPEEAEKCLKDFKTKGCELPFETTSDNILSITNYLEDGKKLQKVTYKKPKGENNDDKLVEKFQESDGTAKPKKKKKNKKNKDSSFEDSKGNQIEVGEESDTCLTDSSTSKEEKKKKKRKHDVIDDNTEIDQSDLTKAKKKKKKEDEELKSIEIEEISKKKAKKDQDDEQCVISEHKKSKLDKEIQDSKVEDVSDSDGHSKKRKHSTFLKETNDHITKKIKESETIINTETNTNEISENENLSKESDKKKKRKRNRNLLPIDNEIEEQPYSCIMGMQVMSKKNWKKSRNHYLNLQRQKTKELKQHLKKVKFNKWGDKMENNTVTEETKNINPASVLEFSPGLIVKIEMNEPCNDPRSFKTELKNNNTNIKYVDLKDNLNVAFVRCDSTEAAVALTKKTSEDKQFKLLTGEEEQEYWNQIKKDRDEKRNKNNKQNIRGRDKLLKKAEKELGKHIKFED